MTLQVFTSWKYYWRCKYFHYCKYLHHHVPNIYDVAIIYLQRRMYLWCCKYFWCSKYLRRSKNLQHCKYIWRCKYLLRAQCVTRPKILTIPIPQLFLVQNFSKTGSRTFFGTNFFLYRFRDFLGNEKRKRVKETRNNFFNFFRVIPIPYKRQKFRKWEETKTKTQTNAKIS